MFDLVELNQESLKGMAGGMSEGMTGGKYADFREEMKQGEGMEAGARTYESTIGLRFWAAMFLLAALVIMDLGDIKVAGITSEEILQVISADYEEVLTAWTEKIRTGF